MSTYNFFMILFFFLCLGHGIAAYYYKYREQLLEALWQMLWAIFFLIVFRTWMIYKVTKEIAEKIT